jgi:hypothetical protein
VDDPADDVNIGTGQVVDEEIAEPQLWILPFGF